MAKKLGISEQEVKEQYTFAELAERNLFDLYEGYVTDQLMPKPPR